MTAQSVDQDGNAISGCYTVLFDSSGSVAATGFRPKTFATSSGNTYTVQADSYGSCLFNNSSDGSTSNPRTFTATDAALGFTAVYACRGVSSVVVFTLDSAGTEITE